MNIYFRPYSLSLRWRTHVASSLLVIFVFCGEEWPGRCLGGGEGGVGRTYV